MMRINDPIGVYVHIPYCLRRCLYCGFYSHAHVPSREEEEAYAVFLLRQMELAPARKADTLFIGGGTPSLFHPKTIERIINGARHRFALPDNAEITLEANPETLTAENLQAFRESGINRLSIGCQSLDDAVLTFLGRVHDARRFLQSYAAARQAGFSNINIDLMFGIPGTDAHAWKESLKQVIALDPEHISLYGLQIEEHTPFYELYRREEVPELDEEQVRGMYQESLAHLAAHGYAHYEISNFARDGFPCRHNLKYWSFQEYLGFGASASSFYGGVRWTWGDIFHAPARGGFQKRTSDGNAGTGRFVNTDSEFLHARSDTGFAGNCLTELHVNTAFDNWSEYTFTALRLRTGVSYADFKRRFGIDFWEAFADRHADCAPYLADGRLIDDGEHLRLSADGIDTSNRIMALFV